VPFVGGEPYFREIDAFLKNAILKQR